MKIITTAFSHINLEKKNNKLTDKDWSKHLTNDEILKSNPKSVNTYDELVQDVAQILFYNRDMVLFYRGHDIDYKDKDGRTTILPSIYRKKPTEKKLMLKENFEKLRLKSEKLKSEFRKSAIKFAGTSIIDKYPEIGWSLLQHYEICGTPLLDLTHSLHVACSFAMDKNKGNTGIVYVLGMPWQTDTICYKTYEELVMIKLLGICPPQAQRPFFQEGYLAGPFPNYKLDDPSRVTQSDFARRLIAKFEIPIGTRDFWGKGFSAIPPDKLYQDNDPIKILCERIKDPTKK
jgi:hypothetical protein